MSTRSSSPSPSPSPPSPRPPSNPSPLSTKKPQPLPWTHQETVHLIQSYQEKWYSLKRGQLKANQWEEVALIVASRCGYGNNYPAKTSIQCRHKMEKLRRRYREEQRRIPLGGACAWQYFDLMDSLERGLLPISLRIWPMLPSPQDNYAHSDIIDDYENNGEDENEELEEEEEDYGYKSKSRSINYILRKPTIVNRFAGSDTVHLKEAMNKRRREEIKEEDREKVVEFGLAGEVRAFAERMLRMEKKKMEMMKETERWKMEMENKRMEMIIDSQKKIVDTIASAFGSRKELKMEEPF